MLVGKELPFYFLEILYSNILKNDEQSMWEYSGIVLKLLWFDFPYS